MTVICRPNLRSKTHRGVEVISKIVRVFNTNTDAQERGWEMFLAWNRRSSFHR
jgi:hypothetical protein